MTPIEFKELYVRELDNLHKEISEFADESKLWATSGEVKNPPGNLCLHLLGNVNHFIGAVLGKNGYIRKRDEEFTNKNISKEILLLPKLLLRMYLIILMHLNYRNHFLQKY